MRPYILLISLALSSCAASQCPQLYMNRTRGSAPCYFTGRIRPRRFRECPLRRRPAVYRRPGRRTAQRQMGFIDPSGATAVPLQYDWCGSFGEYGFDKSVAMVKNEVDKFKVPILSDCPTALIDRKGNRVTPFYGFIFPVRDQGGVRERRSHGFRGHPVARTWASPTGNGAASIRKAASSCRASMSWRTCS